MLRLGRYTGCRIEGADISTPDCVEQGAAGVVSGTVPCCFSGKGGPAAKKAASGARNTALRPGI